jgi:thiamine biosynthesis protein ThiI
MNAITSKNIRVVSIPAVDDIIIDIRHPSEVREFPPFLKTHNILQIPFFKLLETSKELDPSLKYLIYCDKGIMSRLQANILWENGFHNVGILKSPVVTGRYST